MTHKTTPPKKFKTVTERVRINPTRRSGPRGPLAGTSFNPFAFQVGGRGPASGFQGSFDFRRRGPQFKTVTRQVEIPGPKRNLIQEGFHEERAGGEAFRATERAKIAANLQAQNTAIDSFIDRLNQQDKGSKFLRLRQQYNKEAIIDKNSGRVPDTLENWLSANGEDPAEIFADRTGLETVGDTFPGLKK